MDFTTFFLYFMGSMVIFKTLDIIISVAVSFIYYKIKLRKMKKKLDDPELQKALTSLFGNATETKDKKTWN